MTYPFIKPKYYYSLAKDLFKFIKQPLSADVNTKSVKNKVHDTIGLFFIKILFSITVASIISLFYEPENLTNISMSERFSPLILLFVGGIILPTLEEVFFRLSLKFKPIYLAVSSGVCSYYILTKLIFSTKLSMIDESFIYRVSIAILVIIFVFFIANKKAISASLSIFWKNNFRYIYYASCITFAWMHILNFELNFTNLLLLPILTLPQLFSATIAGYTRIAFGFKYPLFVHMATNLLFIALSFIPFD